MGKYSHQERLRRFIVTAVLSSTISINAAWATPGSIADIKVAFEVVNKNGSLVSCDSDGRTYTLRGSLVAPMSVLLSPRRTVTLYIHGAAISGDNMWRMRPSGDVSFDFAWQMARLGHASVSVELVGYGGSVASEHPEGTLVCQGSQADVINQIVDGLKTGTYAAAGMRNAPAFERVGLAGISYGVQFAQPSAYSFRNIDALIVMGYAEPPIPTPEVTGAIGLWVSRCAPPGERKYGAGGPQGYHSFPARLLPEAMFNDPDPAAVAEFVRLRERDPCGQASSFGARAAADAQHLDEITVPVLLAFGARDELFGQPGPQLHLMRFAGSADRRLLLFPDAGHVFFLEKQRATWLRMIAGWLRVHSL